MVAAQLFVFVRPAAAATATLPLTFTSDNPRLNSDPSTTANFNALTINNGSEGAPGATTADTNLNQIYTWRLPDLTTQVCSQAALTSLRVVADVSAATLGNPDLSALFAYRVDGSDQYNLGNYTIQQGTDYATSTGFATPPNNGGIFGVVRGSAPVFGGQLNGQLEATWDLSSYDATDQFGLMVQQDSQDGSVDLQTSISTVELTYDDSNCVYDGAVTKTLLDPASVHPGGTATYEIVLTNNGTEAIGVNGLEDRGVYEIPSSSLIYQSVSSTDIPDIACTDYGAIPDVVGNDQDQLVPYHNHLTSHMLLCASQSSALIPAGESRSFQVTFAVSADATRITNLVSYVIEGDPGLVVFAGLLGSITPEGPDMIDMILDNSVSVDNAAVADYTFPIVDSASAPTKLASSGSALVAPVTLLTLGVGLTAIYILRRRHGFSIR